MALPRNEWKFYISPATALLLERRLSAVLKKDTHTEKNGSYRISSLYFDDPLSSAYFDKVEGIEKRCKYRIRTYHSSLDYIRLEKKEKIGDKSIKRGVVLSRSEAESLFPYPQEISPKSDPLWEELYRKIRFEGFAPVLFVDYTRKAFLHPAGNVRITIDQNLTATPFTGTLLPTAPPIPTREFKTILEVKFDSFFPPYLSALLEDIPKERCSISKFAICRELLS